MGPNVARRCGRRLGRVALVFPLLVCVGVLASLTIAEAPAKRKPLGPDRRFVIVVLSNPPDVDNDTFGK